MRPLRQPNAHESRRTGAVKVRGLLVSLLIIVPLFTLFTVITPVPAGGSVGSDDSPYWPQFQRTPGKRAIIDEPLMGIRDPAIMWDLGLDVLSMGTTAADLRNNIHNDDRAGYDRDVAHLLFSAENSDGNTIISIVDGGTGESAWELDLGGASVEAGPVTGYLNGNDRLDIVFADTEGRVYAYEPVIRYTPGRAPGERYSWDTFNIEAEKLWVYETGLRFQEVSPLLMNLNPGSGQTTMDVVIPARDPDSDTHSMVYALRGDTVDGAGVRLWSRQLEGELPSSVSAYEHEGLTHLWIACYSGANEREYLYRLKGTDGVIQRTISQRATRGYWDKFIPSPVVTDMDDDGDPDIVLAVPMDPRNNNEYGTVYVFNHFGEQVPGWEYGVPIKGRIGATPAVGDMVGDGRQYIVIQAWYFSGTTDCSTVITALKRDGSRLWSREFNTASNRLQDRAVSSPVLFDLDGDGGLDVIAATNPRLMAFNGADGSFMPGFNPGVKFDDDLHVLYDSPAIGDFNGDGILDIVIDSVLISHRIAEIDAGDFLFNNDYPEVGDTIRITADSIYNNGTKDAANVVIQFLHGDTVIQERTYTINAGQTADPIPRVDSYQLTESGWQTFTVVVDPEGRVEELDRTNNVRSKRIFVAAPYDFNASADTLAGSAQPRGMISFPVSIENIGTREDHYFFEGSGLPPDWNWRVTGSLEGDGSLRLGSRDWDTVSVEITVPSHARAGESAGLGFNVTGDNAGKTVTFDLAVDVLQEYRVGFALKAGGTSSEKRITPGGSLEFDLIIHNTGNGMDNFTLIREDPPEEWGAYLSITNINRVAADRSRDATLTLTAPGIDQLNQGNQEADITLTLTSRGDGSVRATVRIRALIARLSVTEDHLSAYPGENATYTIEIFNREGNDTVVDLDAEFGYAGWAYRFHRDQVPVPAQSKVTTLLDVSVPGDADPWTVNILTFEAVFQNQTGVEDVTVSTEARQRHLVNITSFTNLSGGEMVHDRFDPGETRQYRLTFENAGNWYDSFELSADTPAGWDVEFQPTFIEDMERQTHMTATVTVTCAAREHAFVNRTIPLRVSSIKDNSGEAVATFQLEITVNRVRSLELLMETTQYSITPEETLTIPFTVRNSGNWHENLSLHLLHPPGVDRFFIELDGTLDSQPYTPFGERSFVLTVIPPHALDPQSRAGRELPFLLSVTTGDTLITEDLQLDISILQVFGSEITGTVTGTIKPEETRDMGFRVKNLGNGNDTMSLLFMNQVPEWRVSLVNRSGEEDQFDIVLGPGEVWDFTLRITAPHALSTEAVAGFLHQSAVGAISKDGSSSYVIVNLTVEKVYSTSIEVNTNQRRIIPGESVNYTLTIRNMGNGDDNIDLTNTDPPNHWALSLVGGRSFPLPYGDRVIRTLRVSAPDIDSEPRFGDTASVTITAVSASPGTFGSVMVNTTISYLMPIDIEIPVDPGATKAVLFHVMDVSGSGSNVDLECGIHPPWDVRFASGLRDLRVSLYKYEQRTVTVFVTAPPVTETTAGDRVPVWVDVTAPDLDPDITVTMIVKAVYDFNATTHDEKISAKQGTLLDLTFSLSNTGNAVDIYSVFHFLPRDEWNATFSGLQLYQDGDEVWHFISLEPRNSTEFHLRVHLPEYVAAGEYEVLVAVRSDHGKSQTLSAVVDIDQEYRLRVETTRTGFNAGDGDDVVIQAIVENLGNGNDGVSMGVLRLPEGWGTVVTPSTFSFPAGTAKAVTVTVSVPVAHRTQRVELSIEARSAGSGESFFSDVTIDVVLQDRPDLAVESITFSKEKPREGSTLTITATVANIGNAVARNVVVQFYLDGNLLGERSIATLSPSTRMGVEYQWKPVEGSYMLTVAVDPAGLITETDRTNNELTEELVVSEASTSNRITLFAGILVLILLSVALMLGKPWDKGLLGARKRSPGSGPGTPASRRRAEKTPLTFDYTGERSLGADEGDGDGSDRGEGGDGTPGGSAGDAIGTGVGAGKPYGGTSRNGTDRDPALPTSATEASGARITLEQEIFPVILPCPGCRKKIRIAREGKFRCPNCSHIGRVDDTGEVVRGSGPKITLGDLEDDPGSSGSKPTPPVRGGRDRMNSSSLDPSPAGANTPVFPLKYKCGDCSKRSTVEKAGWYKCPFCGSIHEVDDEGGIDRDSSVPSSPSLSRGGGGRRGEASRRPGLFDDMPELPSASYRTGGYSGASATDRWLAEDDGLATDGDPESIPGPAGEDTPSEPAPAATPDDDLDLQDRLRVTTFPAVVACPSCDARMRVRQKGTFNCPSCGEMFPVGKPAWITSSCPWCDVKIRVRREGEHQCPKCSRSFHLDPDGSSGARLDTSTMAAWKEHPDMHVSLDSLHAILTDMIPGLSETDTEGLHAAGYHTFNNLQQAAEVDLALAGLSADMATKLHREMERHRERS